METINENSQEKNTLTQPKKSKKGLYITLLITALLAISVGIYWNINKNNNDDALPADAAAYNPVDQIFSVSEYDQIPENYKMFVYNFMDVNKFLDGTYFLTKIPDRAKSVYAFGDFTDDDNDDDDMAVLFEHNDFKSSMLVIFNHKGEVLFVKKYENELPTINSFKVGSKIYENEAKLTPATCGGLIIKTDYRKEALVYDKKTKKFNLNYQYTEDEIKSMNEPEEYYEEDYSEEPVDNTPEESIINSINEDSN
ncbi:hypothetical protein P3875_08505 [Myroides sp. JBRI-B21084]|uniref:hypothetical protein n=1 Tax=Myroides sp. JBRI-B21084 TaxID=3119977 RepID=UPI0026E3A807|nr:hypothetical protein [Paenimyroides cloacae]WKW45824.1 hypothetical protein P3875_08505 [Paenimyroides cloacae]